MLACFHGLGRSKRAQKLQSQLYAVRVQELEAKVQELEALLCLKDAHISAPVTFRHPDPGVKRDLAPAGCDTVNGGADLGFPAAHGGADLNCPRQGERSTHYARRLYAPAVLPISSDQAGPMLASTTQLEGIPHDCLPVITAKHLLQEHLDSDTWQLRWLVTLMHSEPVPACSSQDWGTALEVVWMDEGAMTAFNGQFSAAASALSRDPAVHALVAGLLCRMAGLPTHGSVPEAWLQPELHLPITRLLPASLLTRGRESVASIGTAGAGPTPIKTNDTHMCTVSCLPVALSLPDGRTGIDSSQGTRMCVPAILIEALPCDEHHTSAMLADCGGLANGESRAGLALAADAAHRCTSGSRPVDAYLNERIALALASQPACTSLFNMDGACVYQNAASLALQGPLGHGALQALFAMAPAKMHEMLAVALQDGQWAGVLRVPLPESDEDTSSVSAQVAAPAPCQALPNALRLPANAAWDFVGSGSNVRDRLQLQLRILSQQTLTKACPPPPQLMQGHDYTHSSVRTHVHKAHMHQLGRAKLAHRPLMECVSAPVSARGSPLSGVPSSQSSGCQSRHLLQMPVTAQSHVHAGPMGHSGLSVFGRNSYQSGTSGGAAPMLWAQPVTEEPQPGMGTMTQLPACSSAALLSPSTTGLSVASAAGCATLCSSVTGTRALATGKYDEDAVASDAMPEALHEALCSTACGTSSHGHTLTHGFNIRPSLDCTPSGPHASASSVVHVQRHAKLLLSSAGWIQSIDAPAAMSISSPSFDVDCLLGSGSSVLGHKTRPASGRADLQHVSTHRTLSFLAVRCAPADSTLVSRTFAGSQRRNSSCDGSKPHALPLMQQMSGPCMDVTHDADSLAWKSSGKRKPKRCASMIAATVGASHEAAAFGTTQGPRSSVGRPAHASPNRCSLFGYAAAALDEVCTLLMEESMQDKMLRSRLLEHTSHSELGSQQMHSQDILGPPQTQPHLSGSLPSPTALLRSERALSTSPLCSSGVSSSQKGMPLGQRQLRAASSARARLGLLSSQSAVGQGEQAGLFSAENEQLPLPAADALQGDPCSPGAAAGAHTRPKSLPARGSGTWVAQDVIQEATAPTSNTLQYHEVRCSNFLDPLTGARMLVLVQTNVTARILAKRQMAQMLEAEHKLLESIFPVHVLEHVVMLNALDGGDQLGRKLPISSMLPALADAGSLATAHEEVTLLFADIVGFTPMCKLVPPAQVMAFLNDLFSRLDSLLDMYGVYKVETIGDCYVVAGGLMSKAECGSVAVRAGKDPLHAVKTVGFAKAMLREAQKVMLPTTGQPVQIRVGLHSGPVMSGVVGKRMPRFCLFGDTINTAARMESTCTPGCIQASTDTHAAAPNEHWRATGGIEVKGKGLMDTYMLQVALPCKASNEDGADKTGGWQRFSAPGTREQATCKPNTAQPAAKAMVQEGVGVDRGAMTGYKSHAAVSHRASALY